MKRFFFIAVTMVIAAFATAKTSWPTTTEVGKFNVSPSWPVEVQFHVAILEGTAEKFPMQVTSWPTSAEQSRYPFPVNSWPKFPESRDSSTKEKRHPAER